MSIRSDREALRDHLGRACAAAPLARPATVIAGVVKDYYAGTFPLVEVIFDLAQLTLIPFSRMADLASDFKAPGRYIVRIRSATDDTAGIDVDGAENELYDVQEAIVQWLRVAAHRTLPDAGGLARVTHAGPPYVWKATGVNGPYTLADGTLGAVLAGSVTLLPLGLPSL